MSKYIIEEVKDLGAWDAFVEQSPGGTIFAYSFYINLAVDFWKIYWVKKGNQVKAGISLILSKEGDRIVLDDLVIHNGLIFAPEGNQSSVKARHSRFEITEFVVEWMTSAFQHIEISLSPNTEDLRPYLWHNYFSKNESDKFSLGLKYTSYLDISEISNRIEETQVFKRLEVLRRRNIREARDSGSTTITLKDSTLFMESYVVMMNAKNSPQDQGKLTRLKRLIDGLIDKGRAKVYLTRNKEGDGVYLSIFGWDSKRAYYLFGAPVPGSEERYKGTISFWDAFIDLSKEQGVTEVDLEGVNSPLRGWYKLSFGGNLVPYYHVIKVKE